MRFTSARAAPALSTTTEMLVESLTVSTLRNTPKSLQYEVDALNHDKTSSAEETLVPDVRAGLSPAEAVERRLTGMLRGVAVPMSHVRMAKLAKGNLPAN